MTAREFETELANLATATTNQRMVVMVSQEQINRLLRTAFRDPRIVERVAEQIRVRGVDTALAIAANTHALPRRLWFGALRGGIFNPGERARAEAALAELPGAFRDMIRNRDILADLEQTRERVRIERDSNRAPTRAPQRDNARKDGRDRTDDR